jgi:hypothetical protein
MDLIQARQHFVLHWQSMLDIIEQDLFSAHMPSVSFLRMDGSTPTNKRFEIQQASVPKNLFMHTRSELLIIYVHFCIFHV